MRPMSASDPHNIPVRLLALVCALPFYLAFGLPYAAFRTWRARRRLRQHGTPVMLTRGT